MLLSLVFLFFKWTSYRRNVSPRVQHTDTWTEKQDSAVAVAAEQRSQKTNTETPSDFSDFHRRNIR